ncbi:MAG: hypothetical protein U0136_01465 [Bdellovibrionota bacterium]
MPLPVPSGPQKPTGNTPARPASGATTPQRGPTNGTPPGTQPAQGASVFSGVAADRTATNLARISHALQQLGWTRMTDVVRAQFHAQAVYPPETTSGFVMLISLKSPEVIEVGEYSVLRWNYHSSTRGRATSLAAPRLVDAINDSIRSKSPEAFVKALSGK